MDDNDLDFSNLVDEAMKAPEDDMPNILDEEDESYGAGAGGESSHGGDIDDEDHSGNRLNLDQLRAEKIRQADTLLQEWNAEKSRREQEYKDAQAAYRKARKAVIDDGADEEQEFQAQEALMDARLALDKANDGHNQAVAWQNKVKSAPELSSAQKAWIESNPRYMSDTRFQQQANRVMARLRDDGFDDTRAPFYERVNKALREKPRMGQDRRPPTGGAPAIRTSKSEAAKAGAAKISQGERLFIQRLGYNPNDKRVEAQYIESRNNTRAAAMRRGRAR